MSHKKNGGLCSQSWHWVHQVLLSMAVVEPEGIK